MIVPWFPATVNNAPSDSIRAATQDIAMIGRANAKVPGLTGVPPKVAIKLINTPTAYHKCDLLLK